MEDIDLVHATAVSHTFPSNMQELCYEGQIAAYPAIEPHAEPPSRGQYSKEQWEIQKPVIWHLYNVENKPYRRVVEILRTDYSFYLTYVISHCISYSLNTY